jgi:Glycogen recognition site of AMP-activated protein kinase
VGLKEQLRFDRERRQEAAHELAERFAMRDKIKRALRASAPEVEAVYTPWYRRAIFTPVHALVMAGAAAAFIFGLQILPGIQQKNQIKEGLIPVEFSYHAPEAKTVELAGDFAEWRAGKVRLERGEGGNWHLKISLPPGRYQYQFVVDGVWTIDPRCPARVNDDFGKENSLLIL